MVELDQLVWWCRRCNDVKQEDIDIPELIKSDDEIEAWIESVLLITPPEDL